jgi:hypothetical protein
VTPVEQIADAILYEGYILYPYRATALKNAQRWNFGVLYPPAYAAAQQGQGPSSDMPAMQCECPARGGDLSVAVRFLQLVTRDGKWQEAIARQVEVRSGGLHSFVFPEREDEEDGVVRRQERVEGSIEVTRREVGGGWSRVTVRISNNGAYDVPNRGSTGWADREAALRRSMVSTHAILHVEGGEFASLLEPPDELQELAAGSVNTGLWPVLVGDAASRNTMLASPIILYDYPQVAPQSAGALFDGTEIDEILSLRILALTDDEKREMRETDAEARRVLERTESLDAEQWMRLHGVMRDPGDLENAR